MATDVKLDAGPRGDTVVLDGGVVQANAFDFVLDSPSRHKGPPGLRRALVHDFNDGLTVNWAGDYPGGVTINGHTAEIGPGQLTTPQVILDRSGSIAVSTGLDQVIIRATIITLDTQGSDPNSAGDVKFTFEHPSEIDQDGNPRTPPFPETVLLGALLTTLRDTVTTLTNQVNSLLDRVTVLENK
jgi:hypothetical protein